MDKEHNKNETSDSIKDEKETIQKPEKLDKEKSEEQVEENNPEDTFLTRPNTLSVCSISLYMLIGMY